MRVEVKVPPSLLTRTASNMITPDPSVLRPPTCEGRKKPCSDVPAGDRRSTCHVNEVPGEEHVNKTASPGHATLVFDIRDASFW